MLTFVWHIPHIISHIYWFDEWAMSDFCHGVAG